MLYGELSVTDILDVISSEELSEILRQFKQIGERKLKGGKHEV